MITLYSKTVCPYCVNTKNYLQSRNIPFREVNIEQDADAREFIVSEGHRTVPQIYYAGKLLIEGGWTGLSKMSADDIRSEIELRDSLTNGTL